MSSGCCMYDWIMVLFFFCFFFQAEDGIRDLVRSRGLGDVYKRQDHAQPAGYIAQELGGSMVYQWVKIMPYVSHCIPAVSYTHLTLPTIYSV